VNGRAVRDRGLAKAVSEGFRAAGAAARLAEAVLFVEAPLHLVDVNVHPAKAEVRFSDPGLVWKAVMQAVRDGLSQGVRGNAPAVSLDDGNLQVREAVEGYLASAAAPAQHRFEGFSVAPGTANTFEGAAPPPPSPSITVLGQHRGTYIVASDGDEVLFYDQHTSHERVRFEAILESLARGRVPSQRLLTPLVAAVAPSLLPLLEDAEHAAALAQLGYEVEPFGGGSLRLGAVPELVAGRDPLKQVVDLLADFQERERSGWLVSGAQQKLAATLACHSAARGGETLSAAAMQAIVDSLARTAHPTLCPHGRPTVVRVPAHELTRWFERVGWTRR
jgi:DNA mismatch repair protein MutL